MPRRSGQIAHSVAVAACRAALARGPLVRDRQHWRFGPRRFNSTTVRALLDDGTAIREGDRIVAAAGANRR